MIFKIVDGRECFYQWDTNRQIAVDDPTITEVHFCNRVDNCSLVVEVVDGVANVPNLILQYGFKLKVFGYDGEATMHEQEFEVKARTKPSDYVYTETEIKRFDDLNKRIDEIEAEGISQEAIDTAVGKYLEDNPIQEVTKVSQLENDAGYATGGYVDSKVAGIVMPDLEPYAKKTDIPDTTGLASKSFVVSYVGEAVKDVEPDLTDYAKKSDIPKDYLTEIPAQYVTESELQAKGYSTFSGRYADLTGKPEIPSTDGLAPVTYVDNKFNSINLTDYAKKAEVATTYAKKSDIPTDYLKEVPAEYVTENELSAKNYANKTYVDDAVKNVSVDTTGLATEEYVDNAIEALNVLELVDEAILANPNIIDTVTIRLTSLSLEDGQDSLTVDDDLRRYIDGIIAGKDVIAFLDDGDYMFPATVRVNETDALHRIFLMGTPVYMSGVSSAYLYRYNVQITHYKSTGDAKATVFRYPVDTPATQKYVDEKIAAIPGGGGSADLSNYYTKDETNQAIQNALNAIGVAEGGAY